MGETPSQASNSIICEVVHDEVIIVQNVQWKILQHTFIILQMANFR